VQLRVLQLVPGERGGDGRAGERPHRVGRDGRLRVRVARDVHEHPAAALLLAPRGRELVRAALGQPLGDLAGGRADDVGVRAAAQRRDDVQAARAGRLGERLQPQLAEQLAELDRTRPDRGEVPRLVLVGRVEVEHHAVRPVGPVGAALPGVRGDAILVGEPHERRRLAADRVGDVAAAAARHGDAADPLRRALGDLLLHDDGLVDPGVPAP
jgi:hypothetical protein